MLRPRIDVGSYPTDVYGDAPLIDSVVTAAEDGAAVFLVNRSRTEAIEVTVDVTELGVASVTEATTLWDDDVYAKNTLADQERVGLKPLEGVTLDGSRLCVMLPPVSWSAIALS